MTALNDRFWAKVLFKEFIKHYRKLSNEERLADIEASMDALEDLDDSGTSFGSKMVKWSMERVNQYPQASENGKKGGRPKKNPQDAPHGNAGVDCKSATSCDQFTADGDTREDSQAVPAGSAITRNETRSNDALEPSANNCGPRQAKNGDAATREAEDESATVSNPLALDMPGPRKDRQTAKTRDSRGSGRYQPPSLGPEDGNLYDQETASGNYQVPDKVSTNKRRTGGPSLSQTSSLPPVRQSEPDVLSLAYSGEFGNVRLTQEQYAELGIRFGNQQKLNRAIDSLSCKIENEEIKPRNHYAELVKWASYREDMEEQKMKQSEAQKMTDMEKSWIREAEKIARYEKELQNEASNP